MKEQQKLWVNRINKIYNLTLGLLGGMSLMHLILVLANPNLATFLQSYGPFSNLICMIFQVLTNFTLVFGLALNMIYKNKSDEMMKNMDKGREDFLQHYNLGVFTSVLVFISWVILNLMPKYTNKFHYNEPKDVLDSDYTMFKIMTIVSDGVFIISWLVASFYNKAAIESMDLDPEDEGGEAHREKHIQDGKQVDDCSSEDESDYPG